MKTMKTIYLIIISFACLFGSPFDGIQIQLPPTQTPIEGFKQGFNHYKKILNSCQDPKNYSQKNKEGKVIFETLPNFEKSAIILGEFEKLEVLNLKLKKEMTTYFENISKENYATNEILLLLTNLNEFMDLTYKTHIKFVENLISKEEDPKIKKEYEFYMFKLENNLKEVGTKNYPNPA